MRTKTIYCSRCRSAMNGQTEDGLCSEYCRVSAFATKHLRALEGLGRRLDSIERRLNRMAPRSPLRAVGIKGT